MFLSLLMFQMDVPSAERTRDSSGRHRQVHRSRWHTRHHFRQGVWRRHLPL